MRGFIIRVSSHNWKSVKYDSFSWSQVEVMQEWRRDTAVLLECGLLVVCCIYLSLSNTSGTMLFLTLPAYLKIFLCQPACDIDYLTDAADATHIEVLQLYTASSDGIFPYKCQTSHCLGSGRRSRHRMRMRIHFGIDAYEHISMMERRFSA